MKTGVRSVFTSAPHVAVRSIGTSISGLITSVLQSAHSPSPIFHLRPTRSGRSRSVSGPLCPMASGIIHKPGSNILSISSRHRLVDVSFGSESEVRHPLARRLVRGDKQTLSPYPQGGCGMCSFMSGFPRFWPTARVARQIGGGFSVFGRKLKGLHEEFRITGSYCFATDSLPIGESAEIHYR